MKIICIGRNYKAHAAELNNPLPEQPLFFLKPETALIKDNKPFFIPDFSSEINYEVEVVYRFAKPGKNIQEAFANRYYEQVGIGIDFTARDLQAECKAKGLPWEIAKAFDGSAPLGEFLNINTLTNFPNLDFKLMINGVVKQESNTSNMIFKIDYLIAHISKYITLKTGDLIYTGTPEGVGNVKHGDRLQAFIEDKCLLDFEVK